jgi:hypothetical protein
MTAYKTLFFTLLHICLASTVLALPNYDLSQSTTTATTTAPSSDKKVGYFGIVFKDDTEQIK